MSSAYYNVSGAPVTSSAGASAVIRSEFAAIAAGFALLPALSGNAGLAVVVNPSGTALTVGPASTITTTGAFTTVLAQVANVTLTLPATSQTLATLAGTETFTNKTLTSPAITGATLSGTTTLSGALTATGQTITGGTLSGAAAVGIGMVATNILDITQNQNALSEISLLNNSSGIAAGASLILNNGTHNGGVTLYGASYTSSGVVRADGLFVGTAGAGGLTLATGAAEPIYFAINNAEIARFDASGRLLVGYSADHGGGQPFQVNGAAYFSGALSLAVALSVADGGTGIASGTSGGVLAFTATGTIASSGALTANKPVIGGGAGAAPTVGTTSGNTTTFATTSGALTSTHLAAFDASGNVVDGGAPPAVPFSASFDNSASPSTGWAVNTVVTVAHSLGAIPFDHSIYLKCLTTQGGFSVGAMIKIASNGGANVEDGIGSYQDATNVYVIIGGEVLIYELSPSPGSGFVATPANWGIVVKAWK